MCDSEQVTAALGIHDPDGHEVRFYTVPLELPPDLTRVASNASAAVTAVE